MTKERVFIFTIIIAVTIGAVMLWRLHDGKISTKTVKTSETEEETEMESAIEKGPLSENCEKLFEDAKYVTVEKVSRIITEDADGNSKVEYDTYFISDIDLAKQTENSMDYAKAVSGSEFDETKIKVTTFEKELGFSLDGLDGWTIYQKLLAQSGISQDLDNVKFDSETFETTGQELYVLKGNSEILDTMQKGVSDEKVADSHVTYQTAKTEDGIVIPNWFQATVSYTTDSQTVTKSMYLSVTINNWDEEEEE